MKGKHKKIILAVLLLVIAGGAIAIASYQKLPEKELIAPFKVSMFKVGKADAIVLEDGDKTMVIDAGEEEDGEEVLFYLKSQGIEKVDKMIITHYDQDHVGGADTLIEEMEIDEVIVPNYEGSHTEYLDFVNAAKDNGIELTKLTKPVEFQLDEASVLIEPPTSYEGVEDGVEMDNNLSLITTVVHGKNRLVFTGDAEKIRIRDWLKNGNPQPCDFLKVPHHGVYNTALKDLFKTLKPRYAAICSSNKNPAEVQTLELLKEDNVSIFETKDGNITVISDGEELEVHQALETQER